MPSGVGAETASWFFPGDNHSSVWEGSPPSLCLIRCSPFILYGRAVGKACISFLYWVVWNIQLSIYTVGLGARWQGEIGSEASPAELPSWCLAPSARRNSQGRSRPQTRMPPLLPHCWLPTLTKLPLLPVPWVWGVLGFSPGLSFSCDLHVSHAHLSLPRLGNLFLPHSCLH